MDSNSTQPWGESEEDVTEHFASSTNSYDTTQPFYSTQAFVNEDSGEGDYDATAAENQFPAIAQTQPFSEESEFRNNDAMWSQGEAETEYEHYEGANAGTSGDHVAANDDSAFQYDCTQRFVNSPDLDQAVSSNSFSGENAAELSTTNVSSVPCSQDSVAEDIDQVYSQPESPSSDPIAEAPQSPDAIADESEETGYYGSTQEFATDGQDVPQSPDAETGYFGSTQEFDTNGEGPSSPAKSLASAEADEESHSHIDSFLGGGDLPNIDNLEDVPTAERLVATLEELEGEGSDFEDGIEKQRRRVAAIDSDDEQSPKQSEAGDIIRDIFGESDEEAGEFQGFDENEAAIGLEEVEGLQPETQASSDSEDKTATGNRSREIEEYDFDIIMRKRKEEQSRRRRKRKDVDIINDSDEMIQFLIEQMREAAREDRELNEQKKPASKKRKLLPHILMQLKKQDLQLAFIDSGVVNAIMEWLSPLPDRSLPALEIRTELLKILKQFPPLHQDTLKSSNIGKVVMYLYRHPKEAKENRQVAGKLISEWARPIFNIQSDFRSLTKEEREQRDYEHMPQSKKRRLSTDPDKHLDETELGKTTRPGERGYIPRARVPRPSTKDYIIRPKWNVEGEFKKNKGSQKKSTVLDKKMREFKERTKPNKSMRAVTVNISGNKM